MLRTNLIVSAAMQALFIALKLLGVVAWSWWLVFTPVWFWLIALIAGVLVATWIVGRRQWQ